jgi:hypothetical protein
MGAVDLARATDLVEVDPVEAARVGATAAALVLVLEARAVELRERTREREVKVLRLGRELEAKPHLDFMGADRLARRAVDLSKAAPFKSALARVARAELALVAPELKAGPGTLWEGAVVARRSTRTRADSGLRAKAEVRVVLVEREGAARAAEQVWLVRRRALGLPAEVEWRAQAR